MLAYGKPQGNVTRLRNGSLNVAVDQTTEVAQKNVVYFKETTDDPLKIIEDLETIGFPIREIDQHFTFFLPRRAWRRRSTSRNRMLT